MNKLVLGLMVLILLPSVSAVNSVYDIIVEENGNSLVVLQLEGRGTYNVPLPLDVTNPAVKGALYVQSENGIDVSIGSTDKAVIVYKTSLLTSKKGDQWIYEMEAPAFGANLITVSLPTKTVIMQTEPAGAISQSDKYLKVKWFSVQNQSIKAVYVFGAEQISVEGPNLLLLSLIGVLTIVIAFLIIILIIKSRKPEKIDKAKEHVIKTLSRNEATVVNLLLANSGSMKRNRIEKESRLAKSSLASCLNALERKNIIRVDKTYTVHFIELTDWFRGLK